MLIIKSNQFQVTEAMKDVAIEKFRFLGLHELENLRLTVETLKAHHLRIKVLYQQPKQKALIMEVVVEDFYKGIDQLAKKLKNTLKRQEDKLRRRHDKLNLGLAFSEFEALKEVELQKQLETVEVSMQQLTLIEALTQLDITPFQILMYEDLEDGVTCTLVKQPNGSVKRFIGIQ